MRSNILAREAPHMVKNSRASRIYQTGRGIPGSSRKGVVFSGSTEQGVALKDILDRGVRERTLHLVYTVCYGGHYPNTGERKMKKSKRNFWGKVSRLTFGLSLLWSPL